MAKGIYCYIDKKNDKIVYIGRDSHLHSKQRDMAHKKSCNYNKQKINQIIQNNPNRYLYKILWEISDCTDNHLNQMEIFYIKKYDPQFNFTEGGDGISGYRHTEKSKKKMSESKKGENNPMYGKTPWNKGKTHTLETRKKMSEARKGKTHSLETRKKIGESQKGKTISEETRKKMSEAQKGENHPMYGKTLSEETKKKISEAKSQKTNKTGFFRVYKYKKTDTKKGFLWCYKYPYKSTRKVISSVDLKKLEEKVRKEGLEWKVINKENSIKSIRENEM